MAGIPELLYHTVLTVFDDHPARIGFRRRSVFVLNTHATLPAAKAFAAKGLETLGYEPSDFVTYAVHDGTSEWSYGDGNIVFAKAPAGQEFVVSIDTTPNPEELSAGPDGTVQLAAPQSKHHHQGAADTSAGPQLHYVLQTKVDYDQDRGGVYKATEIEGCYLHRKDAIAAAKNCLKDIGDEFAQYDEREDLGKADDWPFGEDVLVHAVSQSGENYSVAVRTILGAHEKHAKKNQK
ncbi:hypothetical protein SPI_02485 [Niveomyces insectorum RCEF 264]|uniref:Uncharacterized protein n=1 Tax=Niveomyces insectorum RCEF 264 TaxID=1081102 RepID=A0A162KBN6_9HYPO|nr:hypothetical protein SPI_02485 [Niveomyces insectorum RCEF 264]